MLKFFAKAAIPVLVGIVFALARKYLPATANKLPAPTPRLEDLDVRFKGTQWVVGLGMVATGLLLFVSLHSVLVTANKYVASLDGRAEFVLLPQSATWFFLPGFAAIALTWEVTLWIWSHSGSKQTALLYESWSNMKTGFDATRVLRIMALVIVLPIAVVTALALPEHDSLTDTEILSYGYGFLPVRVFHYSDAARLGIIDGFRNRDGRLVNRAGCVLYFRDGRKWSSAEIGDFKSSVDPHLVRFIENKTGLRPSYARTEADLRREPAELY